MHDPTKQKEIKRQVKEEIDQENQEEQKNQEPKKDEEDQENLIDTKRLFVENLSF